MLAAVPPEFATPTPEKIDDSRGTMSPRTTEAAGPTQAIHAAPSPAVVQPHRAPSSTAVATEIRFEGAAAVANRIPVGSKQRRKGKPLSSGWKSLAWTKPPDPPAAGRRSSSPTLGKAPFGATPVLQHYSPGGTGQQQQQEHLPQIVIVDPAAGGSESDMMRRAMRRSSSQGGGDEKQQQQLQGTRKRQPHASAKRSSREGYLVGIAEGTGSPARTTTDTELQPPQQQQQQQQQQQ